MLADPSKNQKTCLVNKYLKEHCHQDFKRKWSLKWVNVVPRKVITLNEWIHDKFELQKIGVGVQPRNKNGIGRKTATS